MNSRLLVADRAPSVRETYCRFFSNHGYQVEAASDGVECLDKLRHFMPDVLVLEWQIQWGGGDGVLGWVREKRSAFPIDVIVTSANGTPAALAQPSSPPIVACVKKPIPVEGLLEIVRGAAAARKFAIS